MDLMSTVKLWNIWFDTIEKLRAIEIACTKGASLNVIWGYKARM